MQNHTTRLCASDGCSAYSVGKSKYCGPHRAAARTAHFERVNAQKVERENRYARFAAIVLTAHSAGQAAAAVARPVPMVVKGYESSPVMDGACGFAWVTVRPGNCSFAIWAKKNMGWSKAYRGGVQLWISAFNQSITLKNAYAHAYAQVLQDNGIEAHSGSRLD